MSYESFHLAVILLNAVEMLPCKLFVMLLQHADDAVTGEYSAVDITFANNVSVIPSSPNQHRPNSILRERNLPQQQRFSKSRHITLEHLVYYVDEE